MIRYVRSNMGLVHAVEPSERSAVCGTALRSSWESADVSDWRSEPYVCWSCDDVLMGRGRRAHRLARSWTSPPLGSVV